MNMAFKPGRIFRSSRQMLSWIIYGKGIRCDHMDERLISKEGNKSPSVIEINHPPIFKIEGDMTCSSPIETSIPCTAKDENNEAFAELSQIFQRCKNYKNLSRRNSLSLLCCCGMKSERKSPTKMKIWSQPEKVNPSSSSLTCYHQTAFVDEEIPTTSNQISLFPHNAIEKITKKYIQRLQFSLSAKIVNKKLLDIPKRKHPKSTYKSFRNLFRKNLFKSLPKNKSSIPVLNHRNTSKSHKRNTPFRKIRKSFRSENRIPSQTKKSPKKEESMFCRENNKGQQMGKIVVDGNHMEDNNIMKVTKKKSGIKRFSKVVRKKLAIQLSRLSSSASKNKPQHFSQPNSSPEKNRAMEIIRFVASEDALQDNRNHKSKTDNPQSEKFSMTEVQEIENKNEITTSKAYTLQKEKSNVHFSDAFSHDPRITQMDKEIEGTADQSTDNRQGYAKQKKKNIIAKASKRLRKRCKIPFRISAFSNKQKRAPCYTNTSLDRKVPKSVIDIPEKM